MAIALARKQCLPNAKQQNWKGVALILTNIDVLRKNKNKKLKV